MMLALALAVSACAYESSGTTTTTSVDPDEILPSTGPADLVLREQRSEGAGVVFESVTMPAPGFVVLYEDEGGLPGEMIGTSDILSAGVIANVPVSFFVPLNGGAVVHAQIHIDMDRNEAFTYEPPDAFVDVPAVKANGEVVLVAATIGLLPPISPASVTFGEQRIIGDAVTVASADLPAAGFVVIREDDQGGPGRILGISDLLPAGISTDIEVVFDDTLGLSAVMFASVYIDRDADGILTLGDDPVDRIAQADDGLEVTIGVPITVVPLTPVHLTVEDQESEGVEVIATVTIPAPSFLVIRSDDGGVPGEVLVVSGLLDIGTTSGIALTLDPPLDADTTLWFTVHIDLDGNGEFDGVEPIGILEGGDLAETSILVTLPVPEEEETDS
jgi:hypothetical protein